VNAETQQEVDRAVDFARNSPFPEEADLYEDMWANPIPQP
jgi:TPP-dependent pyruvate/acetoin dehydrogenase alpha subunit